MMQHNDLLPPIDDATQNHCAALNHHHLSKRGFTLLETIVVIGLILILVTLTTLVGTSVTRQAKVRQCTQQLDALDSMLSEYQAEYDAMPPYSEDSYFPPNGYTLGGEVRPEVAVFIDLVRGLGSVDNMLAAIPPDTLMERGEMYESAINQKGIGMFSGSLDFVDTRLTIRDPWGMEILYIDSQNIEATTGEGVSDYSGYGIPAARRPYFMSAGPDRIYYDEDTADAKSDATRKDNIYSYQTVNRPDAE